MTEPTHVAPARPGWPGRFSRWFVYLHTGWRGKALTAGFALLTLAAIALLIRSNWAMFTAYTWHFRPKWLLFAILAFDLVLLLSALAWHLLMRRLGGHLHLRTNLKYWAYANLAKRLPTPVWYIGSRAVMYEAQGVSKTTTSLVSGLELGLILVSGLVLFLLTLPFWAFSAELADQLAQSWLLLVLIPLCALLLHPRLLTFVWRKLSPTAVADRLRWRDTLAWVALYLLIWGLGAFGLYCTLNIFQPIALTALPALLGMWAIANTVSLAGSLTLANIGLREISLTLLLTPLASSPAALLTAIAVRLIWLVGEFLGAMLSLIL